ncbi:MAG TPA: rhomboid family intramembrane serine protease [Candidatus Xenobia bacterium]|jgi:membrane associated rhomboid family serine protease
MIPLYGDVKTRSAPVVTTCLVLANLLAFVYELTLSPHGLQHLVQNLGVVPHHFQLMMEGHRAVIRTLVPYFASMFLHGGWAHIIGNMLFLWAFGRGVEDRQGPASFLAFYLFCGLAAGVTQTLIDPHSPMPCIGASGAIAGVLGAYLLYYPGSRIRSLVFLGIFITTVSIPAILYLGLWFVLQAFHGAASLNGYDASGIAYFAHVGGFLSGFALAPHLKR